MRILVFGDSITQGYHDDEMNGWCNRLALVAQKKTVASDYEYNTSVFNLGISGNNSDDLIERIDAELEARLSDREGAVLFAIGVNDSQYEVATGKNCVSIDKFRANLELCIKKANKYSKKIYLLTLLPIDDSHLQPMPWKSTHGYKQSLVDEYNFIIREVAQTQSLALIDVSNIFGADYAKYLPDGIHPNAEGHRFIFERVEKVLEENRIL